jgi:transcriptional regulator with XRE-family HTH domain
MELTKSNIRLIFGLKLKQLRVSRNLSLSELAHMSSVSVSYLNEIESGKKYPKADKIIALAEALGVSYDNIVSIKLSKNLAPIGELLDSNILSQLPIDHYGIDINKLIALLANAPIQLNALVSTIIEIARSSEMSRNIFSRTALRIYKEFNENYFADLEEAVENFKKENKILKNEIPTSKMLANILSTKFGYKIDTTGFNLYPELSQIRAVVKKQEEWTLYTNSVLSNSQFSFIVGKEIAYNYLDITDRSYIYSSSNLESFDQLLNNLRASYYATGLQIPKDLIIEDFKTFLALEKWDKKFLLNLLKKYNVTPEILLQRISSIAPKYFNINKFFFLRFNYNLVSNEFELSKELHLNTHQNPGGYQSNEHYCRRWISIGVIEELKKSKNKSIDQSVVAIQKSKFINSNDEYLSISIAKPSRIKPDTYSSVTLGFLIDNDLLKKVNMLNDTKIKSREVNDTCENCGVLDCKERVSEPHSLENKRVKENIKSAIKELTATK